MTKCRSDIFCWPGKITQVRKRRERNLARISPVVKECRLSWLVFDTSREKHVQWSRFEYVARMLLLLSRSCNAEKNANCLLVHHLSRDALGSFVSDDLPFLLSIQFKVFLLYSLMSDYTSMILIAKTLAAKFVANSHSDLVKKWRFVKLMTPESGLVKLVLG